MSREILDCLKRERDIYVKNVIHSQNTAFMFTPALSTSRGQSNLRTVSIFVYYSCEEKGCYGIVSLGHYRSYCGLSRRMQSMTLTKFDALFKGNSLEIVLQSNFF